MKIFKKFSFWLPLVYLCAAIFLFFIVPAVDTGSWSGLLIGLLPHPINFILFILGLLPVESSSDVLFPFINLLIFLIPLVNLLFWFLIGLLIDKIISRFRKNNI